MKPRLRTTSQSGLRPPRPGCGTQHPQRFACVLLAAAPTTTPCFRHWRRSSLLPLVGEPLAKRLSFAKCQRLSLWESWREAPERARPLAGKHRHSDSIALTKSLPIAAQRLFRAGLALSVIASQCHLSQRERLWQAASFPVSFWRIICYNGFAALPAHFIREGGESNELYSIFCSVCRSKCNVVLHLQVA